MRNAIIVVAADSSAPLALGRRRGRGPDPAPTPTPTPAATAQDTKTDEAKPRMDIYGFAMLDMGYQTEPERPGLVRRPAADQAAAYEDEFGEDGHFFAGVRQSRLGVKGFIPTDLGEIKTIFEFELFGTGVDAGQTTFRLRHAWGELGQIGRRPDVEPVHGHRRVPELARVLGTERHGLLPQRPAALDAVAEGRLALHDRPRAAGRQRRPGRVRRPHRARRASAARFPLPDLSAHFRYARARGATSSWPASCGR